MHLHELQELHHSKNQSAFCFVIPLMSLLYGLEILWTKLS